MEVDVRSAVYEAKNYLQSIQDMLGSSIQNLLLEEVELTEDKKFWLITLGYNRPLTKTPNPLAEFVPIPISQVEREYKTFKVDAETGEVQAMKIRQL